MSPTLPACSYDNRSRVDALTEGTKVCQTEQHRPIPCSRLFGVLSETSNVCRLSDGCLKPVSHNCRRQLRGRVQAMSHGSLTSRKHPPLYSVFCTSLLPRPPGAWRRCLKGGGRWRERELMGVRLVTPGDARQFREYSPQREAAVVTRFDAFKKQHLFKRVLRVICLSRI